MARHLRVEFPGAIYHVSCRMIGGQDLKQSRLFVDDQDRARFIECLSDSVEQYNIRLYLFTCMVNHYHLVFETPEGNIAKFMQALSTAYTVYYNLRHNRHGHLLDGRYKAKLVEGAEYLLALSRYVHLNPVRVSGEKDWPLAEQVRYLRSYAWGTYASYIGERKAFDFVEYGPILGEMSGGRGAWPRRYREFVERGITERDEDLQQALKASPRSIGGAGFRGWVDELYQKLVESGSRPEDAAFRRITEVLPADMVLGILAEEAGVSVEEFNHRRRDSYLRGIAGRYLVKYAGLTQREVAARIGAGSGGAISRQMRKVRGLIAIDRKLRQLVERADKRMASLRQAISKTKTGAGKQCR